MSTTKQQTIEQAEAWFQQAMGCSESTLQRMIARSVDNLSMLSMSILSDAQELLAMEGDNSNQVRQLMNRSKYVIGKHQDRQRYLDSKKPAIDLPADLGYVIELASHRADMWKDHANGVGIHERLSEFYECDDDELESMADSTASAVRRVSAWFRQVRS